MDPEVTLISDAIQLGIGGVVAVLVLLWKRADDRKHQEDMKSMIERAERREDQQTAVISANTAAVSSLNSIVNKMIDLDAIEKRLLDKMVKVMDSQGRM